MSIINRFRQHFGRSRAAAKNAPELLYTDKDVRITSLGDPSEPNLLMCFTGIRQAMGGIGAEEFVGSARMPGYSAIFITDLQRSWFNGFDPALLQNRLRDRVAGRKIVTLGNSMGGYGAIWAARHFPVNTAIAFAPQYSVHPEVVPAETRWMEFRRHISHWRDRSLDDSFVGRTVYYTINGSYDELHWSNLPTGQNCQHVLIENSRHEPAAVLKEHGLLSDTIALCIEGGQLFDYLGAQGLAVRRIGYEPGN